MRKVQNRFLLIALCTVFLPTLGQSGEETTKYPHQTKPEPWAKRDDDDDRMPVLERIGSPYVSVLEPMLELRPASVTANGYASVQVNVTASGNNKVGDAANEPSMSIDRSHPNRIAVGWRQFDSVMSNFRQAGNAYSTDGGITWHNNQVFTPGTFRSDPVLDVDANGKFYYNSLQQTFYDDIFGSVNGGALYKFQGPATGGDKQWMTIDRTTGIGRGNLYQSWSQAGNNYGGRQFSRSVDGGYTWSNPINLPNSLVWGTLDVANSGDLYIGGSPDFQSFGFCSSHTVQNKNVTPKFEWSTNVNLGGTITYSQPINPEGLGGQTWLAVDKSSGPYANSIYMACSVYVNANNPLQFNIVRSRDGGHTWSAPHAINDDSVGTRAVHWFGCISVAPNGRVDAMWFDNRTNPGSDVSALYYSHSIDGGATWSKNVRVSPFFDPHLGYPQQNKMGDYMTLISANDGARISYAATFNREEDIWFLKVPALLDHSAQATNASTLVGTLKGGTFSSLWNIDTSTYNVSSVKVPNVGQTTAIVADYPAPTGVTSVTGIKVHTTAPVTTIQSAYLYNWTTSKYDLVQSLTANGGTSDLTFGGISSLDSYVMAGKLRIQFKSVSSAGVSGPAYDIKIDQLQFIYG